MTRRPPWVVFERAVSLRLDLRAAAAAPAGFEVRELGRAEVEPVLGAAPALALRSPTSTPSRRAAGAASRPSSAAPPST